MVNGQAGTAGTSVLKGLSASISLLLTQDWTNIPYNHRSSGNRQFLAPVVLDHLPQRSPLSLLQRSGYISNALKSRVEWGPAFVTINILYLVRPHSCEQGSLFCTTMQNFTPMFNEWWDKGSAVVVRLRPHAMVLDAVFSRPWEAANGGWREGLGTRLAYDAFLLRALQVAFRYAAIINASKEAYPWSLIVLCHCRLASFTEAP